MLKAGTILANRYEIVGRVGSGGMADVYKAKDGKLNRFVAVKVMKSEFKNNSDFVRKFTREAQAAAGLANPNIVNVFDVGDDNGIYYIVMELVEGITLKEYIEKKGKLSVREATSIAIQVCMGLAAAHSHGIVHRDVKPQNIIISTNGKVKVTDFGIARAASSNTISSNAMGSVHYSSPEQVRGGFADAKSDIYSLGITMYEMVTGRVPFDGDTTVAIAIKHLQDEMDPPSKYTPDLPYALEQIIYKCTQKDVNRRYASVDEVIEDLKRSLVDPNGHFVQLTPLSNHAQTIMISPAEMAAIKAGTTGGRSSRGTGSFDTVGAPNPDDMDETEDPDDEDDYDEEESSLFRSSSRRERSGSRSRSERDRDYDDEDDDDEGISGGLEKAMTIGGFIVGAIIIVILIYFIGRAAGIFHFGSSSSSQAESSSVESSAESSSEDAAMVEVPDLMGLSEQDAQARLTNSGLGSKYQGEEASDTVAEGSICRQDPAAGTKVAPNTTINYYRSSGPSSTSLPNVVGMTLSEAQSQLSAAGFTNVTVEQSTSDTVAINTVISMSPEAGTSTASSEEITLVVSTGTEESSEAESSDSGAMITVSSYTGLSQEDATSAAQNAGLAVNIEQASSSDVAAGEVIAQSIESGTQVPSGTTITFIINTEGAAPYEASSEASNTSSDGTWIANESLGNPSNYTGGAYRLTLEQNGQESLIVEGDSISFPYRLSVVGASGTSEGVVYLYELVNGSYVKRANWTVPFSKS